MTDAAAFSEEQVMRYARHMVLPGIGGAGQRRLLEGRVLVLGAGGLGSPAAMYLAAAGVGTIGVVDFDRVELANLQRQLLHDTGDVGRLKVVSATERIKDLNPEVEVVAYDTELGSSNALTILRGYDVVVDGTDTFPARYLANDAAQMVGVPLVHGSVHRFEGQASVFLPGRGHPCYRCLFPEPPPPGAVPTCAEAGVFGALPGIIGSVQAVEAIKLILGVGDVLAGRLLVIDALAMEFRTVSVRWDPGCAVCGERPTVTELIDYERFCGLPPASPPADRVPPSPSGRLAS